MHEWSDAATLCSILLVNLSTMDRLFLIPHLCRLSECVGGGLVIPRAMSWQLAMIYCYSYSVLYSTPPPHTHTHAIIPSFGPRRIQPIPRLVIVGKLFVSNCHQTRQALVFTIGLRLREHRGVGECKEHCFAVQYSLLRDTDGHWPPPNKNATAKTCYRLKCLFQSNRSNTTSAHSTSKHANIYANIVIDSCQRPPLLLSLLASSLFRPLYPNVDFFIFIFCLQYSRSVLFSHWVNIWTGIGYSFVCSLPHSRSPCPSFYSAK